MGKEAADSIISKDKVKKLMQMFDRLKSINLWWYYDDYEDAGFK